MMSICHLIWIVPATAFVFLMLGGILRGRGGAEGYQPQQSSPIGDPPTVDDTIDQGDAPLLLSCIEKREDSSVVIILADRISELAMQLGRVRADRDHVKVELEEWRLSGCEQAERCANIERELADAKAAIVAGEEPDDTETETEITTKRATEGTENTKDGEATKDA